MRITLSLLALAGLLATPAHAVQPKESGFYVGGVVGGSTFDDDGAGDDLDLDLEAFSPVFGAFGGYRFSKYLATEGRFTYLGDGADDATFKSTALTANVVGILPLGNGSFELFGQLGIGGVFVNDNIDDKVPGADSVDDEIIYTTGLGIRFWGNEKAALSLQYDFYTFEADAGGSEDYDVSYSLVTLGVTVQF